MKVIFSIDSNLGHFMAAMAALEQLKKLNPSLDIEVATPNEGQALLTKNAWFVSDTQVTRFGDIVNPDSYDMVHQMQTDIVASKAEELRRRQVSRDRIDQMILEIATRQGVSVDSLAKPDGYEDLDASLPAAWNLVQGYAFNLMDVTGWDCYFKDPAPAPWVPTVAKEAINQYLHTHRKEIRPGKSYMLIDNFDWMSETKGLQSIICPESWECIFVDENIDNPELIIGLIANPRCKMVIGPTGGAIYAAWGLGVPAFELNTSGQNSYWTASRDSKATVISSDIDNFAQSIPRVLQNALTKRYGFEWEN